MQDACHISIYIDCPPQQVYAFASHPPNLPQWAAGLARSEVIEQDGVWVATAPFGKVKITFTEPNSLGVMDHTVELESGMSFLNPMRVVPNGAGSELTFVLFRQPEMTDEAFHADQQAIEADLHTLKNLLEA